MLVLHISAGEDAVKWLSVGGSGGFGCVAGEAAMRWSFVDGSGGDGIVMAAAACPAAALDSAWIEPVVYELLLPVRLYTAAWLQTQ